MSDLRHAMSDHDKGPLTPAELRKLADEMEESLINHECNFSHPDWRVVDGLYALAAQLEPSSPAVPTHRAGHE